MSYLIRNNVKDRGSDGQAIVFALGFGCDQNMWHFVAPAFENDFRTVLFDRIGAGASDLSAYSFHEYAQLDRYADDLIWDRAGPEFGARHIRRPFGQRDDWRPRFAQGAGNV